MSPHSLSAAVECGSIQFVGVAAVNNNGLVDIDFYCKKDYEPELVHVSSACDKKIPFSQKGVEAYVTRTIQHHGGDFYGTYRKVIQENKRKDELANVVESVSATSSFSVTPNSENPVSELKITIKFTDEFDNKALPEVFKNKNIFSRIDGATLHLTCIAE